MPQLWTNYKKSDIDLNSRGKGSYHLKVLLSPKDKQNLALNINWIYSSYKIYINNKLLTSAGDVRKKISTRNKTIDSTH